MKKGSVIFAFVLILGLLLATVTSSATARPAIGSSVAVGDWSTGTEVAVNLEKTPAPYDWYNLLTEGVKISAPGEICHPFRGGQYKWIADIRQLVNGKWVKVPTTQGWLKGEEAHYMACAQAPSAGTYAMFGYYTGPSESPAAAKVVSACPAEPINYYDKGYEWKYDEENEIFLVRIRTRTTKENGKDTIIATIIDTNLTLNTSSFADTIVSPGTSMMYFTGITSDTSVSKEGSYIKVRFSSSTCYEEYTLYPDEWMEY